MARGGACGCWPVKRVVGATEYGRWDGDGAPRSAARQEGNDAGFFCGAREIIVHG